eukprot:TRINITY_DN20729_c0_g1_i1.p1 TRINITY_DN20729_c0_g1~~TRINITY_DN20729_c0_g1_i1.p1  ORF type:complete len:434 (-),score=65.40 TRINITY_DN20729_c0_g1_i1:238-1539(-)
MSSEITQLMDRLWQNCDSLRQEASSLTRELEQDASTLLSLRGELAQCEAQLEQCSVRLQQDAHEAGRCASYAADLQKRSDFRKMELWLGAVLCACVGWFIYVSVCPASVQTLLSRKVPVIPVLPIWSWWYFFDPSKFREDLRDLAIANSKEQDARKAQLRSSCAVCAARGRISNVSHSIHLIEEARPRVHSDLRRLKHGRLVVNQWAAKQGTQHIKKNKEVLLTLHRELATREAEWRQRRIQLEGDAEEARRSESELRTVAARWDSRGWWSFFFEQGKLDQLRIDLDNARFKHAHAQRTLQISAESERMASRMTSSVRSRIQTIVERAEQIRDEIVQLHWNYMSIARQTSIATEWRLGRRHGIWQKFLEEQCASDEERQRQEEEDAAEEESYYYERQRQEEEEERQRQEDDDDWYYYERQRQEDDDDDDDWYY